MMNSKIKNCNIKNPNKQTKNPTHELLCNFFLNQLILDEPPELNNSLKQITFQCHICERQRTF